MDTSGEVPKELGSTDWWASHSDRLARRRPRAGGLTLERIVDETIALTDANGLDALTVRALAAALDTSSASLYRHVGSVDELAILALDRVLGEIVLPDAELTGRARVTGLSNEFRRVLRAHPGLAPALRAGPLMGPNATRGVDFALASLTAMGYAGSVARAACLALIDYVLGSTFFDTAGAAHNQGELGSDEVFDLAIATFLDGLGHTGPNATREH